MALNNQALVMYLAIDSRLRKKPAPSLEELLYAVTERLDGKEPSKRSLQLAIQNMRQHGGLKFYAPIQYNKREKVYQYTDPEYKLAKAIEQNN